MRAIVACLLLQGAAAWANVNVKPPDIELDMEPASLDALRDRSVRAYNVFLSRSLQTQLTVPVTVNYATSMAQYQKRLAAAGHPDPKKARRQTAGVNFGCKQIELAVLEDMFEPAFNENLWHEMTHSLQCQWAGGFQGKAPSWMHESTANFYAQMLLREAGQAQPFTEWLNKHLGGEDGPEPEPDPDNPDGGGEMAQPLSPGLRDVNFVIKASEIATAEGWQAMGERHLDMAYKMADVMMTNLYVRLGEGIFPALRDYYTCLRTGSHEACFEQNMGLSYADFLEDIDSWIDDVLRGKQEVVIASADAPSAYVRMNRMLDVLVPMMDDALAGERQPEYRLIPSIDSDMNATLHKNDAWINLSFIQNDAEMCRVLTHVWMTRYVDKTAAQKSELFWMYVGLERWLQEQVMHAMQIQSLEQSQAVRKKILSQAKMRAVLQSMQTRDDWLTAAEVEKNKTDAMEVLEQAAAMAVGSLIEQYGLEKVKAWTAADQTAQGKEITFAKIFGLDPHEFLNQQANQIRAYAGQAK